MSVLTSLRKGVRSINKATRSLQARVSFSRAVISTDGFSQITYPSTVQLRAIVDWKQKQLRTTEGILTVSRASVMFVDITEVVAATAGEGIDDHDRIVLPDGTTGPILDMSGFIDAGTGHPIATEVFLG